MNHIVNSTSDLLVRLKAGDKNAFDAVYTLYWPKLFKTALHVVDDEDTSKDIIQDVFVYLWEKAPVVEILNLEAYLVQAVKYRCFMHLRSGKISEKHMLRVNTLLAANTTEETLMHNELQSILDTGIASLPDKCKEVFYLSRFESLSNKKIAKQLNISPKTVENQITKALRLLRLSVDKLALLLLFNVF